MAEFPQIFIDSKFFNHVTLGKKIIRVENGPFYKRGGDLSRFSGKSWDASSISNGANIMVTLSNGMESHKIFLSFAFKGCIKHFELNNLPEDFETDSIIRFYTDTHVVYLCDPLRMSHWTFKHIYYNQRGPDIVLRHNDWRDKIYNYRRSRILKKPVFEIMLDRRFFNGIGNFCRCEILARTRCSPFMNFNEVLKSEIMRTDFFEVCRDTLMEMIWLGGMQYKCWKNPFGVSPRLMNGWSCCYNNMTKAFYQKDLKGRFFWFDKKFLFDYLIWAGKESVKKHTLYDLRLFAKIYTKKIKNTIYDYNYEYSAK